jgi:hypothetical protein
MGSWLYCRFVGTLPLLLGPRGHGVARDGSQPCDVTHSDFGFNERAPDQVGTIRFGVWTVSRGGYAWLGSISSKDAAGLTSCMNHHTVFVMRAADVLGTHTSNPRKWFRAGPR